MAIQVLSNRLSRSLLATLLANGAAAGVLASFDAVHYSDRTFFWIGPLLWVAVALTGFAAALCVWKENSLWLGLGLSSTAATILLSLYVVLLDFRSAQPSWQALVPGVAFFVVNTAWFMALAPRALGQLDKGWAAIVALFPFLGMVQLWIETDFLPRYERPLIDMAVMLEEVGRDGDTLYLRGEVTLENRSPVEVAHVGSVWQLRGYYNVDESATDEVSTPEGAVDWFSPPVHQFRRGAGNSPGELLALDNVLPVLENFLLPGQKWSTDFVTGVNASEFERVRLTAHAAFITGAALGQISTCNDDPPRVLLDGIDMDDFIHAVGRPIELVTSAQALCVNTRLSPRTAAHAIVDDAPTIQTLIVIDDPSQPHMPVPYLRFVYGTPTTFTSATPLQRFRAAKRIDASYPSVIIQVWTEHPTAKLTSNE